MNGMNLQDLYKQYGSKPISEYMNEQMQSNGYSQNMGQNQMVSADCILSLFPF